jgi:hypothetical protein
VKFEEDLRSLVSRFHPVIVATAVKIPDTTDLRELAMQAAEKVIYFVIPNEVRNLSLVYCQEKRDSSARSAPRNDKKLSFSASRVLKKTIVGDLVPERKLWDLRQ